MDLHRIGLLRALMRHLGGTGSTNILVCVFHFRVASPPHTGLLRPVGETISSDLTRIFVRFTCA